MNWQVAQHADNDQWQASSTSDQTGRRREVRKEAQADQVLHRDDRSRDIAHDKVELKGLSEPCRTSEAS
eukprot:6905182-Heterocapsa_arctica.AAC.1